MGNNEYSLTQYLSYLRDDKLLSPLTIELYAQAMKATKIDVFSRKDIPKIWADLRHQLESNSTGKIFIEKTKTLVRGSMRRKGWPFVHDENYAFLTERLNDKNKDVLEYTDDEIGIILAVVYYDVDLFNACVLQSLSGLRAGALKGLKWTDFHEVVDVPDVMIYKVISKGKFYVAAISSYIYYYLKNRSDSEYVVNLSLTKSNFSRQLYLKLHWYLVRKYNLINQLDLGNKSLQHSMRHYFVKQITSALNEEDAALLTGHKVYHSTLSKYVNKQINKIGALPVPAQQTRIATLYKQTPVFNYRIEKIKTLAQLWRKF